MLDKDILLSLRNLNSRLKSETFRIFDTYLVSSKLAEKGQFKFANKIPTHSLSSITKNRPIIAVDGSRLEYGSFYPYYIAFMRTLASTTGESDIVHSEVLTPLNTEIQTQIETLANNNGISPEEALKIFLKNSLALLEIKTALTAAARYKPYMIMLDGGFLLFDKFAEWDLLCNECIKNGTILVGVIEEIATAELARLIEIESIDRPRVYDREILYGLLDKGQYLHLYPEYKIKRDYCTIFARLSTSPQATGCDFLGSQESYVDQALNILYTLTPDNGQGIPAWLQIVDAKVRLRRREMDKLLYTCLDKDLIERYFIPNRERRIY